MLRGLRGATTASANEREAVLKATREMLVALSKANAIKPADIAAVIFSSTPDLNAAFPAAANISGHPYSNGDVVIGSDVWIGRDATILSGITIGNGAVIAASSVVVKDVPAYMVVGGNPARCIKNRFSQEVVEELQRLQWWQFDDATLNSLMPYLLSPNVEALLSAARRITQ